MFSKFFWAFVLSIAFLAGAAAPNPCLWEVWEGGGWLCVDVWCWMSGQKEWRLVATNCICVDLSCFEVEAPPQS